MNEVYRVVLPPFQLSKLRMSLSGVEESVMNAPFVSLQSKIKTQTTHKVRLEC
jgi:hypothetical protein